MCAARAAACTILPSLLFTCRCIFGTNYWNDDCPISYGLSVNIFTNVCAYNFAKDIIWTIYLLLFPNVLAKKVAKLISVHLALNFVPKTFEGNWRGEEHSSAICVCVSVDIFTQQLSVPDGEVASVPIWGHLTTHLHSCSSPIFHSIFALDKGGASADTKYNSTFRLGSSSWKGHFSAGQPGNKVYKIILKICILTSNLIDFFNHCNAL